MIHFPVFVLLSPQYMRYLAFTLLLLVAQAAAGSRLSHLTIYSRAHYRFTVYLDGERRNLQPSDSVRVLNLTREFYHLRIEFEDSTLKAIDKKSLQMTDATGRSVDALYELRRNKKGEMVLSFIAQTVWPVWIDPTRPEPKPFPGSIEAAVQQRKANKQKQEAAAAPQSLPATPEKICKDSTLTDADYREALSAISASADEDGRMTTARQIIASNCITVNELTGILHLLYTDERKIDLAAAAYTRVVNKGLFFKVKQELKSDASFEKLMKALPK